MKLVFAHDHWFLRTADGVTTDWQFTAEFWRRYLRHFDEIVSVGRDGALAGGLPAERASRIAGCPGVRFELFPNLSSLSSQLFRRRAISRRMEGIVAETDGVVVRLPSELGMVAIRAACRLHRPWAVVVAGCGWDALWNYGTWRGRAYAPAMFLRMRRIVARAPFALYVTRSFLQTRYPVRSGATVACSNVEVVTGDRAALSARQVRIANEWGHGRIVLGMIGTLKTRYKGIQTVFTALQMLRNRFPGIEFRILGAGNPEPWRREAETHGVEDMVHFDGTLPGGAPVLRWLDQVDLYCQPSFVEGLPRALIEAMSRGCPAVGSTAGGIPELLDSEWLIRPGDVTGLVGRISSLLGSAQAAHSQAVRNWELAKEYDHSVLDARRAEFWSRFAAHCAEKR